MKTILDYMEYASDAAAQSAYVTDASSSYVLQNNRDETVDNRVGLNITTSGIYEITRLAYPFTPTSNFSISKVELELRKVNSPTGNIWVEIWSDNGSDDPNAQIGDDSSTIAASSLSTSDNYESFTFGTPISLTSGTKYWIVLTSDRSLDDTNIVELAGNVGSETTKGHYHTTPNNVWNNWGDVNFNYKTYSTEYGLQSYSESTIKKQGSYSLKGIALITSSLNKKLTRTVSPTVDLTGIDIVKFFIRASRTGSNIKIGLHDSGGTTTEKTINILLADTWQEVIIPFKNVANSNKDVINQIIITILNADVENTFYIDDLFGYTISPVILIG